MLVAISDLIPQEVAGVRGSCEYFLKLIDQAKSSDIPPIKVTKVAGELLVREGHNCILAFKKRNVLNVEALLMEPHNEVELHNFEKLVKYRVAAGMKGFNRMSIVNSEDERVSLFQADEEEIRRTYSTPFWKSLATKLKGNE
jgi:hypothetical protein